jgi:peptidoglycan LD-endopeptidase LytH
MRARMVAAFVLGFAVGLLCLSLVLWGTGRLPAGHALQGRPVPSLPGGLEGVLADGKEVPPPQPAAPPPIDYAQPGATAPARRHGAAAGSATGAGPLPEPPPADYSQPSAPRVLPPLRGEADRIAAGPPPLRLAMPIAGIDPGKINDTFEERRGGHKHEALDILAPRGTPVVAVAEGNVARLFNSKQGGLSVYQFDNSRTWCYYYAHLERYAPGLKEGTLLRKGDVLGFVGTTGNAPANTPHLHFAVFRLGPEKKWWKGTAIDPLPLLQ